MSTIWKTKYGPRRVRHDPPTLDEAIFAARGLTDDVEEQVAIAAGLMELPLEDVRAVVKKTPTPRKPAATVAFTSAAGCTARWWSSTSPRAGRPTVRSEAVRSPEGFRPRAVLPHRRESPPELISCACKVMPGRPAMPIFESTPQRLVVKSGSTILTLDKDLGAASLQRKMLFWKLKPREHALSDFANVTVDAAVDRASGVEVCHTMLVRAPGRAGPSRPRTRKTPRTPRRP